MFPSHDRWQGEMHLPEKFAYFVDDIINGGKVIFQESHKAICINRLGEITEGRTKTKPTNGKEYVLSECK